MSHTNRTIYVPVDDSGHSFAAVDLAVDLARTLGALVVGSHVEAPGGTNGCLGLLEETCRQHSVPFERRTLEGTQHRAILEDIRRNDYDLVVMGAHGNGAVADSQIGSVAERVVRDATAAVLVVKDLMHSDEAPLLVGLDGSPQSLEALRVGLELGRRVGREVEGVVVSDGPMAGPATQAMIAAREAAAKGGFEIELTVNEGKPFERILSRARDRAPWLLVIGRTGADSLGEQADAPTPVMGSTTRNLLRMVPCNILVVPSRGKPRNAMSARMLAWTADAERLLEDIPRQQHASVIRAVEEGARRLGIDVISADTIDKVMLGFIDS